MDFETDVKRKGIISEIIRRLSDLETRVRKILGGGVGGGGGGTHKYSDVMVAHGSNGTVAAGATNYLCPGIATISAVAISTNWPITGTAKRLTVRMNSAQPATGTLVFTVMIVGLDTSIVVTIPAGGTSGSYPDITHTEALVAGNSVRFKIVNNAAGPSGQIGSVTLELEGDTT